MNEPATDRAATAAVRTRRGPSLVWIVPIVALVIGAWLGIKAMREQGPTITITFAAPRGWRRARPASATATWRSARWKPSAWSMTGCRSRPS